MMSFSVFKEVEILNFFLLILIFLAERYSEGHLTSGCGSWILKKFQSKYYLQGTIKFLRRQGIDPEALNELLNEKNHILGNSKKTENNESNEEKVVIDDSISQNLILHNEKFSSNVHENESMNSQIMKPKKAVSDINDYTPKYSTISPKNDLRFKKNAIEEEELEKNPMNKKRDIMNEDFKKRNRSHNGAMNPKNNQPRFSNNNNRAGPRKDTTRQNNNDFSDQKSFLSNDKNPTYGQLNLVGRNRVEKIDSKDGGDSRKDYILGSLDDENFSKSKSISKERVIKESEGSLGKIEVIEVEGE